MEKQAVARMPAQDLLDLLHSSARGLATADIAGAAPAVRAERAGDGADHGAARAGPAVPQRADLLPGRGGRPCLRHRGSPRRRDHRGHPADQRRAGLLPGVPLRARGRGALPADQRHDPCHARRHGRPTRGGGPGAGRRGGAQGRGCGPGRHQAAHGRGPAGRRVAADGQVGPGPQSPPGWRVRRAGLAGLRRQHRGQGRRHRGGLRDRRRDRARQDRGAVHFRRVCPEWGGGASIPAPAGGCGREMAWSVGLALAAGMLPLAVPGVLGTVTRPD